MPTGVRSLVRVSPFQHVEADAVHEQLMRREVIGDLLAREPDTRASIVFGIRATNLLEDRFRHHCAGRGPQPLRMPRDWGAGASRRGGPGSGAVMPRPRTTASTESSF
ncbi:iron-containing redox enzyme family protein [Nocardia sp. NPDC059239]|uniref:iron-containing redox enzyme family protein n=1 Tax=Nocardia sp. NPDC059239 TaxID=3346785 RepID=UPI0036AC2129